MAGTRRIRPGEPPAPRDADELDDTVLAGDTEPPAESAPSGPDDAPPERYRLGAELGRGGMGRVVEAFDTQLGRTVALKEVLAPRVGASGGGAFRRFAREVQLTARLEHPSIVPVYDSGIGPDGRPYYVMRRVTGRPLDELIGRARGLDERLTLIPTVLAAIDAVAHAHRRGVIHRDIKPQNILVGELGETVVIDWGLAKVVGEGETADMGETPPSASDSLRTQIGSVFGTPGFMAPEQARGEQLGTVGDVYALGAVLYQLLGGAPPHSGTSATEVIEKTSKHEVRPLDEVAPGAPPELVTIVGKALALDPGARYPDAGALGEDVRRFLAGQLVAAHRYTPRQRLARFARRHRAALSVLAIAAVAVAVMAWIGVHRIVTERDAATGARANAEVERKKAVDALARLEERHDALLISRAAAAVERNPTEAIAILKQLAPGSQRLGDARAIAQAAVTRGVAWAAEGARVTTTIAQLDPTGERLVQVTRDGAIRVWDLIRRQLIIARQYPAFTRALWLAGGKLLVMPEDAPPQIFDPVAAAVQPLALPPVNHAVATPRGDRVVFALRAGGAGLLDPATRAITALDYAGKLDQLAIADDASWIALGAANGVDGVIVLDAGGRVVTRRPGPLIWLIGSPGRKLAMSTATEVFECTLDPAPVWKQVPLALGPRELVLHMVYRAGELDLLLTSSKVMAWTGGQLFELTRLDGMENTGLMVTGDDTLIAAIPEGKLRLVNELTRTTLALPGLVRSLRLAVRRGVTRAAVIGDGIVLGFDLASVLPRALPIEPGADAVFVDNETMLMWRGATDERWWYDVATGARTPIRYPGVPVHEVWDIDEPSGRVLMRHGTPRGQRLLLLRKGSPRVERIGEGPGAWGRLIPGDAVVYSFGDGQLLARIGDGPEREVAKLDGVINSAAGLGHLRFAAHSTTGELVRGELATGRLERTRAPVGLSGFVGSDQLGRAIVVEDKQLLVWDSGLTEIATFDKPIARTTQVDGGIAVSFADFEARVIELRPDAQAHRVLPPGKLAPIASVDGTRLAGLGQANQVHLVELPSRGRWTLPVLTGAASLVLVFSIAPGGDRVLQRSGGLLALWRLPRAGGDFAAWLDEQTNATVDADSLLQWPWQVVPSP